MKTAFIVLGLIAVTLAAADDFGLGSAKKEKATAATVDTSAKSGEFTSTKTLTLSSTKFSNPTFTHIYLEGDKTPSFRVKIGTVVYYYPLAGTHSGMWLTYKANARGFKKLTIVSQKFRVWYRKSCKSDSFTGAITCGYCFKIFALAGVLDYGATETITISSIKYDLGAYKPTVNLLGDPKKTNAQMEGVHTTVTFQGDEYPVFLALYGQYENKIVMASKRTGKIMVIGDAKLSVYKRKYCKRGLFDSYRCRWCFIMTAAETTTFLPGPTIAVGEDDDGNTLSISSPQHKKIEVPMEGVKNAEPRDLIRFIYSSKGSTTLGFFYYLLDGEEAGQIWYNTGARGFKKTGMKVFVYTRKVCSRQGDLASCRMKFKTYKSSGGPTLKKTTKSTKTISVKAGVATLGRPVVQKVKTPGLADSSSVRAVTFMSSTVDGESFNLNYAMDGRYAGLWFYVNTQKGKTVTFSTASGKALYNYKVCKASGWSGDVKCTWCFLFVDTVESAAGLPTGKTITIGKTATFSLPADVKLDGSYYTRFAYGNGKVNKLLYLKRESATASAGGWFAANAAGRLSPHDVPYDAYFNHVCSKFGRMEECRHCFKIQARPALAIKPLLPAASLTISSSKITLSIYDTRLYDVFSVGSSSHGLAHKFKACKSGSCTYIYYAVTGIHAGQWITKMTGKSLFMKTSVISSDVWKHYECMDGLSGVVCRYCFQF